MFIDKPDTLIPRTPLGVICVQYYEFFSMESPKQLQHVTPLCLGLMFLPLSINIPLLTEFIGVNSAAKLTPMRHFGGEIWFCRVSDFSSYRIYNSKGRKVGTPRNDRIIRILQKPNIYRCTESRVTIYERSY